MPHALRLQALGVRTGLARLDRGHVDDQAAAGQAVAGTVRAQAKQHLFDHIAVFQQAEGDVGPGASLARGGANDGSICGQDFGLGLGAVPDTHWVARLGQAPGHGQAHVAGAQQAQGHRGGGQGGEGGHGV